VAAGVLRVAILSTGEELLRGAIADTNAQFLARTLRRAGGVAIEIRQVGDGREEIARAAGELARRCDLLVVTGGLGPTADDRTREALADAAGVGLKEDAAAAAGVAAFFRRLGREPSPSNRQQAFVPEGARVVPNPIGSAPGFELAIGPARAVALPGVPAEMKAMVNATLLPGLSAEPGALAQEERLLQVAGLAESVVGERIDAWLRRTEPPLVSVTVSAGHLTVAVTDRGDAEGRSRLAAAASELRRLLGAHVFAEGETTLAQHVVTRLRARGETVALAESCTGGLVGAALTDVPGSSQVFLEGCVTYSEAAKIRALNVPAALLAAHGAVSEEVARGMADGVRRRAGATWGVAVTGVAGPDGGSAAAPVGCVHLARAGANGVEHVRKQFPGDRGLVRAFAVTAALDLLRRGLD
jgi:nicotinamide-nucleotide amidase